MRREEKLDDTLPHKFGGRLRKAAIAILSFECWALATDIFNGRSAFVSMPLPFESKPH